MTTFRQISPNSDLQIENESYEYLLSWLSPDSGIRQWFFSNNLGGEIRETKNFTIEGLSDIRSIPYDDVETIEAVTRYLDKEQFDYVRSLFQSNRIYQITKTGDKIPISIKEGKTTKPNNLKGFEINITFTFKEKNVLNV